eukprot:TRINITY_DN3455_c0_g1_i8.p1 TRINITY_DN3455_c0_g1~~TRINITY_DN3455_c0_g1_i8.p1  ORF type:complete len:515 (-),score=95.04 TRINITY_DN3455_c0_g1_i8:532-2076(-)
MAVGSGTAAATRALRGSLVAALISCAVVTFCFYKGRPVETVDVSNMIFTAWSLALVVLYGSMWLLPASLLFRRPALYGYAGFFFLVRTLSLIGQFGRMLSRHDWHVCVSIVPEWILLSPALPLVVYWALLADSRYWHGDYELMDPTDGDQIKTDDIRAPLAGTTPYTASMVDGVANAIEQMQQRGVRLINFASLKLPDPKVLGVGGTARVYSGQWRAQPVAVKMIFCIQLTHVEVQSFTHEANMLQELQHPHIVKVFGVCIAPPALCLVLELCDKNLHEALQHTDLSFDSRIGLAIQCARSLQFLHTRRPPIVHKDIKSQNFLMSMHGAVKLADFGISEVSRTVDPHPCQAGWTLEWAAPELLTGSEANPWTDIYALTITLWECLSSASPYHPYDNSEHDLQTAILAGLRPTEPAGIPEALAAFLQAGWHHEPTRRPSALHFIQTLPEFMAKSRRSYPMSIQQVIGSARKVDVESYVIFLVDPYAALLQDRTYHMIPYEQCLVTWSHAISCFME